MFGSSGDWTLLAMPIARYVGSDAIDYLFAGNTAVYGDPEHGTQIEFHDADGGVMLWYPGNSRALRGEWKVVDEPDGVSLCYRYETLGRNPVTGVPGIEWECGAASDSVGRLRHTISGDVFGLSSGAVLFVLPRGEILSLREIGERIGTGNDAGIVQEI